MFIPKTQGDDLAHIIESGVDVAMQITPGKHFRYADNNLNKSVPGTGAGGLQSLWDSLLLNDNTCFHILLMIVMYCALF